MRPLTSGMCFSSCTSSRGTRRPSMRSWRTSARTVSCPGRRDSPCTISFSCSSLSLRTRRRLRPENPRNDTRRRKGRVERRGGVRSGWWGGRGGTGALGLLGAAGSRPGTPGWRRGLPGRVGCQGCGSTRLSVDSVPAHHERGWVDRGSGSSKRSGCAVDGVAWCRWIVGCCWVPAADAGMAEGTGWEGWVLGGVVRHGWLGRGAPGGRLNAGVNRRG